MLRISWTNVNSLIAGLALRNVKLCVNIYDLWFLRRIRAIVSEAENRSTSVFFVWTSRNLNGLIRNSTSMRKLHLSGKQSDKLEKGRNKSNKIIKIFLPYTSLSSHKVVEFYYSLLCVRVILIIDEHWTVKSSILFSSSSSPLQPQ